MPAFDETVLRDYWPTALVALFLVSLALDFVVRFLFRAGSRLRSLKRIVVALRKQDTVFSKQKTRDLNSVLGEADEEPIFPELWGEYSKTLHAQRGVDEYGQQRILRWRATALAESFFTEQALVNSPLRTEYFKHLPGILTGLGIIGTFSGLIKGLSHFHVSPTPEETQLALSNLIQAVGHAFYLSAAAIVLAILFTCIEKLLLSSCYARVERIQHAIDRLFRGGAGEEYLERLVQACETSATQALHIKEALVADLKQILQEVTAQQVAASSRDSSRMAVELSGVIAATLSGPVTDISAAVERVSSSQGNANNTMLVDVLTQFSERMAEFVEQIKVLVSQSQAETGKTLQGTLSQFGEQVAGVLKQLPEQARSSLERHQQEGTRFAQQTNATVMGLSREVENLTRLSSETSRSLQSSIATLAEETRDSIGRMKSSAELVYAASSEFAKAGERLAARLDGSGNALEKIEAATHLLGAAMNGAAAVMDDYKESRGVFAMMIEDLKGTIQNANKEAFMTSDLIERLGAAASQLGNAEKQSETYLLGINEVLSRAHEVFAQNVEKTLQRGNAQFHKELSEAVGLLSTGIRDLEAVLERVPVEG
jgi:methyl-accepting chemotaxis protein